MLMRLVGCSAAVLVCLPLHGPRERSDARSRCGWNRWLEEQQQPLVGRIAGGRAGGSGFANLALQNAGHARQQGRRRAAQRPRPGLA